ncbi:MAG: glycosyltransferase family A protein [Dongiaceae bacterium]
MNGPSPPLFTILLPIHRPPSMLPYAITSVLGQTRPDFELFVICDGAPPESAACAQAFAVKDARVQLFVHPKGQRSGELYRDQALQSAHGRYVCQIADDDLWFPNHLEEMALLLDHADFGNLLQANVGRDGMISCTLGDLAREETRHAMLTQPMNFFGPTVAGYRLETYRRLLVGWSPAPVDLWPDLFMWRKFLSLPGIVCATRFSFTALHLAASHRPGMSDQDRAEENRQTLAAIQNPPRRDAINQTIMQHLVLRAQLTQRTVRHLARIGGSAALAEELEENDQVLLAELQRIKQDLASESALRKEAKRQSRKPKAMRRLLRWVTGSTNQA